MADEVSVGAEQAKPQRQVKRSPEGSNRNSLRSLHLLEQSYLSLIVNKPADKITVADITREAGLNRGTFYAHFSSVSELEDYVLQHLVDRFMNIGTNWFDISFVENPHPLLAQIGTFVEEHRQLIQTIRRTRSSSPFMAALEKNLRTHIREEIVRTHQDDKDALTRALISTDYIVHGILSVYDSWIFDSYTDQTLEEVNAALEPLIKGAGTLLESGRCSSCGDQEA